MALKNFDFVEEDLIGSQTLEAISEADRFNRWMYETIKPFCKGRVFEVGSGIGNISDFFLADGFDLFLSDIRANYCSMLDEKFNSHQGYQGVAKVDLVDPDFINKYEHLLESFDTVYALNVVEHIKEHELAVQNASKLLVKGGRLVILVPSYRALYNKFDEGLGHYRRYTISSLSKIMSGNGLNIVHKQYFNFVGIFGWFLFGKILAKDHIQSGEMGLYNKLVPVIKIVDKLIFNSIGLSTVIVSRKT